MGTGASIAGLGISEIGRVYDRSASSFAVEAVWRAAEDAGIELSAIDGLLVADGIGGGPGVELQRDLGLGNLGLINGIKSWGTGAIAMIEYAALAVSSGLATAVVCVMAEVPLARGQSAGEAHDRAGHVPSGWRAITRAAGVVGGPGIMAMAARRHMLRFGTRSDQLAHIAVSQREWALLNPIAQMKTAMTVEDHQNSRLVVDPFHLFDCCLVTNGAVAVIVTADDFADDLRQPPVRVLATAQSNPGAHGRRDDSFGITSGAAVAGPLALRRAGLDLDEVDMAQLYDCFTFTVLKTLEDYGYCEVGEGGEFVSSGTLGPGGTLALNTGGGQLSSFYVQGMTPVAEAVIQTRGQAGKRQQPNHDVVLVSNSGGAFDHHATLIVGSNRTDSKRDRSGENH